jgi:N-ethylmaleimide reductase
MVGTVLDENYDPNWDAIIKQLRHDYRGVLMLAGGYDQASAEKALLDGRADLIAFGRPFIANPDLPARLYGNHALNDADGSRFFGGDAKGYIDYPVLAS